MTFNLSSKLHLINPFFFSSGYQMNNTSNNNSYNLFSTYYVPDTVLGYLNYLISFSPQLYKYILYTLYYKFQGSGRLKFAQDYLFYGTELVLEPWSWKSIGLLEDQKSSPVSWMHHLAFSGPLFYLQNENKRSSQCYPTLNFQIFMILRLRHISVSQAQQD